MYRANNAFFPQCPNCGADGVNTAEVYWCPATAMAKEWPDWWKEMKAEHGWQLMVVADLCVCQSCDRMILVPPEDFDGEFTLFTSPTS